MDGVTLVLDSYGGDEFPEQIRNHIRRLTQTWVLSSGRSRIKKIRVEKARNNTLIQLSDMVGGAKMTSSAG